MEDPIDILEETLRKDAKRIGVPLATLCRRFLELPIRQDFKEELRKIIKAEEMPPTRHSLFKGGTSS